MPIQLECSSCGRRVKVKDEYAGRRIRCPDCQEVLTVPTGDDEFGDMFDGGEFSQRPLSAKSQGQRSARGKQRSRQKSKTEAGWFRRHWHWLAVAVMMVFSLWPRHGLVIVGLFSAVGVLMVLIGGIFPFLRIIFGAPGTVALMIVSRSARFEMMNQSENHPYKRLVRTAFNPTRGLFWKGVLLMVMFLPGAIINANIPELFKNRGQDADPQFAGHDPHFPAPGLPNRNPHAAAEQNAAQPGLPPRGHFHQNPSGGNGVPPAFPPHRTPAFRSGDGSQDVYAITLTYSAFAGQGSVEDSVQSAIKIMSGYVEDSLEIDEDAQTIQFQHRGPIAPPALSKLLAQHGFPSTRIQMSKHNP